VETFNVHVEFEDGSRVVESHTEMTLPSAIARLTRGPAAVADLIHEVKVVDMLDCTNFLFRNGKIIFPTRKDLAI